MKKFRFNIRMRILTAMSMLLFISFTLIGAVFNIGVNQYIRNSAINQLNSSIISLGESTRRTFIQVEDMRNANILVEPASKNNFRIQANAFVINGDYENISNLELNDIQKDILDELKKYAIDLNALNSYHIRTKNGVYFVSSMHFPQLNTEFEEYMVFYVDVSGLSNFAGNINLLLIFLVGIIALVAVVIAIFISDSIAEPIRKLGAFASRIGKGDFSQNDFDFHDIEIAELNRSLNHAAKQLEIYDKEQKTFFQNASHELRTPLMSIKCYAEGIEYGVMEPVKAGRTIISETDRLTEMVEDLLYVSKIDNITSSFTTENVDLREIVHACAERQKAVAQNREIVFVYDFDEKPVQVMCVNKLIGRSISNLISNAIRYAKSEITLTCRNQNNGVIVIVADDGDGISEIELPHIFERFHKGKNGNHGIGLSIVKSIVEQHRGKVEAINMEKGAKFIIKLPK